VLDCVTQCSLIWAVLTVPADWVCHIGTLISSLYKYLTCIEARNTGWNGNTRQAFKTRFHRLLLVFLLQLRTIHRAAKCFTTVHQDLFHDLLRLSVSRYMEVSLYWCDCDKSFTLTWKWVFNDLCLCEALRHGSHSLTVWMPCLPLPRKHSPDSASTDWGGKHLIASNSNSLLIYRPERMKGWIDLVGSPPVDGLTT